MTLTPQQPKHLTSQELALLQMMAATGPGEGPGGVTVRLQLDVFRRLMFELRDARESAINDILQELKARGGLYGPNKTTG